MHLHQAVRPLHRQDLLHSRKARQGAVLRPAAGIAGQPDRHLRVRATGPAGAARAGGDCLHHLLRQAGTDLFTDADKGLFLRAADLPGGGYLRQAQNPHRHHLLHPGIYFKRL